MEEQNQDLDCLRNQLRNIDFIRIKPHLPTQAVKKIQATPKSKNSRNYMSMVFEEIVSGQNMDLSSLITALRRSDYDELAGRFEEHAADIANDLVHFFNPEDKDESEGLKDIIVYEHAFWVKKIMRESATICADWSSLASAMDLSPMNVADLRRMIPPFNIFNLIDTMLDMWSEKNGSRGTFKLLWNTLKLCELNHTAEKLLELWTTVAEKD